MEKKKFLLKVAENIKQRRRARGLTQEDVERSSGVMRRHYQAIETGTVNLTLLTLYRIAKVFEVPPHQLIRIK
jgi:transcriptional regulator with XRE-family HTH domain